MSLRNLTAITGLPFEVPTIEDITDQLPTKGSWDTYKKQKIVKGIYYWADGTTTDFWTDKKAPLWLPSGLRPDVTGEEIDTIIVHHMASEAPLVNQANYHVNTHKWPGIAYGLVVSGTRLLQTNNLLSMTFHAGGHNTYTVPIAIHGDLSKREMTSRERELLYAAILTAKKYIPTIKYIKGHDEVNKTSCPCTSVHKIREDIAKLELQMKAAAEPTQIKTRAYNAAVQHNYLYNEYAKDPTGNKWLESYLLKMDEVTREMGMYFGK